MLDRVKELEIIMDDCEKKILLLRQYELQLEEAKDELYEYMYENDITNYETKMLNFTLVRPTLPKTETKIELDAKKLKEEQPMVYAKYLTSVETKKNGRKGYLRMTVKEEK